MNPSIVRNIIYVFVVVSAFAWIGLSFFSGTSLGDYIEFTKLIPKVVTVDVIVAYFFIKWGWKLRIFRSWLAPIPNLNGTFTGYIYSNWVDEKTGKRPERIPTMLTIKQSCFSINCLMRTGEMESPSYCEGFQIDPDRQIKKLAYSYTSNPKVHLRPRSEVHDGTMVFDIVEGDKLKLKGRYWTERKTTGEIELEFHSRDILEELPKDFEIHPVTELENRR